ncbi:DUF2279 domain-containing protein [Adhaeribacter rhizoryzae]|uniref:DUF2279 domain-containing protein n=1 Tax=Adhaeribacter rhizoryzae TaxID=2607907 RepID=A0A5M6DEL7_9BACT|nr:DUF2279 domain-containing protein [Adhaeribacter rhizoryzae]KAA5544856.1 DUF2279 domain-containing protein [Adhaeribacter rhizoryzae]
MKKLLLFIFLIYLVRYVSAQTVAPTAIITDSVTHKQNSWESQPGNGHKWLAGGLALAGMSGSLLYLTHTTNYQYGSNFKTVNDAANWLQLDKAEHVFMAYRTARLLTSLGTRAGITPQKAVMMGSAGSLLFVTTKEFLDGRNAIPGVGWSWLDMGANATGIIFFAAQELTWQDQKVKIKFSALPTQYESALNTRADILFGESMPERIMKDHNAQTYWLSFNLNAFGAPSQIPPWLNLAVGYGANNMFGPVNNVAYANGQVVFDRTDLQRYRQWYISPDIDLKKIKTNSPVLKTLLTALNIIKVPLPTLEYANQKLKGHWLHF